jgi:hypothetical protein
VSLGSKIELLSNVSYRNSGIDFFAIVYSLCLGLNKRNRRNKRFVIHSII